MNKQKIHKLVENDFYIMNELTNQRRIKQFINSFYLCNDHSTLKVVDLDENIRYLNRGKIGADLLLEFDDRGLIYFKNYLKEINSPNLYLFTIINTFKQLLNSIRILIDNNIVHNNINFDNIFADKHDTILLANFKYSIDLINPNMDTYIKHFITAYDPTYIEWPIEIHLLSYLITNKQQSLSSYNIEMVINDVLKHNNILSNFGDNFVSSYKQESLNYFKKYVNQPYNFILTDMIGFASTWDNYALSLVYLRILIGIHKRIGIKNKFIILFMKLLVNNIHLNPIKRLSVNDTLIEMDKILDANSVDDYKQIIRLISS